MKAKEMSEEVYDELIRLDYHRKVNSVYEVNTSVDFSSFDKETQKAISTFPVLMFNPDTDLMDIENLDGEQQFYILFTRNRNYLIDTQGYTYPRYIVKLNGLEDVTADDYMDLHRMDGLIRIADDQIFNAVVKSLVFELREEDFSQEDILNFLQFKLDMAIEGASK